MSENGFKSIVMSRCAGHTNPWTQADLAFVIGIKPSYLSHVLSCNGARLNPSIAIRLGIALQMDAGELMMAYYRVKLAEPLTPEQEMRLAMIRNRAANWKSKIEEIQQSPEYRRGWSDGYRAAKSEREQA